MRARAGRTGADRTRRAGASPHPARRPGGAWAGGRRALKPLPGDDVPPGRDPPRRPGGVMISERSWSRPRPRPFSRRT